MPVTLYFFDLSPPSRAAWLTCKALGLDFETKVVNLMKGEQKTPEYTKINPMQAVPALDDNGFFLNESRAIMTYLANAHGKDDSLYPKDPNKRAVVDQYLNFDLGTFSSKCTGYGLPEVFMGKGCDTSKEEDLKKALTKLETIILGGGKKFTTGDNLAVCDFSLACSITFLDMVRYDFSSYPNISAWLGRIRELPYFKEDNARMLKTYAGLVAQRSA